MCAHSNATGHRSITANHPAVNISSSGDMIGGKMYETSHQNNLGQAYLVQQVSGVVNFWLCFNCFGIPVQPNCFDRFTIYCGHRNNCFVS